MKSFKEMAEHYQKEINEGAKLKKKKTWVPDENGKLKKVLKKMCVNTEGSKAAGYKVVDGKKCEKMNPSEIKDKSRAARKAQITKSKHSTKIEKKALKVYKQKLAKGLVEPKPEDVVE